MTVADKVVETLWSSIEQSYSIFKKYKIIIGIISLLIGSLSFWIAYKTATQYKANLTFKINQEERSSYGGGLTNVLQSFGFGSGSSGGFNLNAILQEAKTPSIVDSVIYHPFKNHTIGDEINELYDLTLEDFPDISFNGVKLKTIGSVNSDTMQMLLRKAIITRLIVSDNADKRLTTITAEDLTGILSIKSKTIKESLSIAINQEFYNSLSKYYTSSSIEPSKYTVRYLENKLDSINNLIEKTESSLSSLIDNKQSIMSSRPQIRRAVLEQQLSYYGKMYETIGTHLATAEYKLATARPFFQIIQPVGYPLEREYSSPIKNATLSVLIVVVVLYFVILGYLFLSSLGSLTTKNNPQ